MSNDSPIADPIYLAIDAHRKAHAAHVAAVDREYALEDELPRQKRRSWVTASETRLVGTDDPAFIMSALVTRHASDQLFTAAIQLLEVRPTTIAGVIALANYAEEYMAAGNGWPEDVVDDDDDEPRDWTRHLLEGIAVALKAISQGDAGRAAPAP
jgi:hypothetical protein